MRTRPIWLLPLALAALCVPARAQAPGPADWPCVQVYRPHLSAGEIWTLSEEDAQADWRADREAARLAAALALGGEEDDPEKRAQAEAEERRRVDAFAAQAGGDRKRMVALLLGVVESLDARRFRRMEAIRAFARAQKAMAEGIIAGQAAFDEGGDAELELSAEWGARIYQERESSLRFLCEKPVELESRAFRIGRMVAAHLDENQGETKTEGEKKTDGQGDDDASARTEGAIQNPRARDEYPTEVKADYVFGCMAVHGQTRSSLLRCSCSMDAIAGALPFADYVAAETVMMMRRTNSGAERISMFRGSPWAREMIAKLKRAQVEADFRCFGE